MTRTGRIGIALAGLIMATLQGTPVSAATHGQPGLCRPEAARALVGKHRVSDRRAVRLTGASLVRQIRPGAPVTMDFRQERVTIETSPRTGRIVRASCG
ncbi:MAG: hypothetical protein BGP04_17490 [Rhizobiales bacterium 62-17]|nr:hypothetical protein [Hyphomicrobiales bacterium]OJY03517.1 MAG: hypothetical protein BGP04_17490 [Rhizobiales bacterium 62-17]